MYFILFWGKIMKKTIFLCCLSIFLFISSEKSIASSIETSSWYQFPPYFPASKMFDNSFTFTYDLPFLVPYNSSWNTRENKRFQQEWLTHYINSKKLIEELMYQCSKNTKKTELQKRCEKRWNTFSKDKYNYLSGLATQEDIQGILREVQKGKTLNFPSKYPWFILPAWININKEEWVRPDVFQIGKYYLITPFRTPYIFIAKKGDTQARLTFTYKDNWEFFHPQYWCARSLDNQVYYFTIKNKKLLMTIVDSCWWGSWDGYESVFQLNFQGRWEYLACYDYSSWWIFENRHKYWYFWWTVQFSELMKLDKDFCDNKVLIDAYVAPLATGKNKLKS